MQGDSIAAVIGFEERPRGRGRRKGPLPENARKRPDTLAGRMLVSRRCKANSTLRPSRGPRETSALSGEASRARFFSPPPLPRRAPSVLSRVRAARTLLVGRRKMMYLLPSPRRRDQNGARCVRKTPPPCAIASAARRRYGAIAVLATLFSRPQPPSSRFPDSHFPGFPRVCALSAQVALVRMALVRMNRAHTRGNPAK